MFCTAKYVIILIRGLFCSDSSILYEVIILNLLISISRNIYPLDERSRQRCEDRWSQLIHPKNTLGKLEYITKQIAGITGSSNIEDNMKKCVIAFGADHGVYEEGVSAQVQEVTRIQFENFTNGKCAVATLARHNKVDVVAVDIGINSDEEIPNVLNYKIAKGTKNMYKEAAMTPEEAVSSIERGIIVAEKCIVDGYKIIGVGEMGISNTTSATAITSVMSGKDPIELVDAGSGIDEDRIRHKADVIRRAIEINNPNPTDSIDVLSKIGGFEIGGIAGVILGCAANRIPVVLDGYISYAAALVAFKINPKVIDYIIPSHISSERGSQTALDLMKLKPYLDFGMHLGEGTGAVLMMGIIDSAVYTYNNMATFAEVELGKYMGPEID